MRNPAHVLTVACIFLLSGCGDGNTGQAGPSDSNKNEVVLTAIENFSLPLPIREVDAAPAPSPFRSRVFIGLDDGSVHALNLAVGEVKPVEGLSASALAFAGSFQLRGVAAPLLITASDTLEIHLFDAENNAALLVPASAPALNGDLLGICILRDSPAYVDFAVISDGAITPYRLRDTGGELLDVAVDTPSVLSNEARLCIEQSAGSMVDLSPEGIARNGNKTTLSRALNGATIASVGFTTFGTEELTLVALPARNRILARSDRPNTDDVHFRVEAGLNSIAIEVPTDMAVSSSNFGGSYNAGVAVLAEDNQLAIVSLDAVSDAIITIDPLKQGTWSQIEDSRGN